MYFKFGKRGPMSVSPKRHVLESHFSEDRDLAAIEHVDLAASLGFAMALIFAELEHARSLSGTANCGIARKRHHQRTFDPIEGWFLVQDCAKYSAAAV